MYVLYSVREQLAIFALHLIIIPIAHFAVHMITILGTCASICCLPIGKQMTRFKICTSLRT